LATGNEGWKGRRLDTKCALLLANQAVFDGNWGKFGNEKAIDGQNIPLLWSLGKLLIRVYYKYFAPMELYFAAITFVKSH
jgi:hypothetical protein